MNLQTIEPVTEPPRRRGAIRRVAGGAGRGGGDGGDGGAGGSGGPGPGGSGERTALPDKSRVITWFLLLVVLMTFGGLMAAYVVVATNGQAEWQPFNLPAQLWISTIILALSSVCLQIAKSAIDHGRQPKAKNWLIATTAFGGAFISSQMLSWLILVSRGLYMSGNPYAGFFYILTIVHAVHVLGGIVALGAIQIRAWHPTSNPEELKHRQNLARSVAYYWHFLGLLWLALLGLLAFWK